MIQPILLALVALLALAALPARPHATAPASARAAVPCDQASPNAPTAARDNLDQLAADWGVYCEGAPTWGLANATAPSRDGSALLCALTGGQPFSNVHCYRNLLPDPAAGRFTLALWFQYHTAAGGAAGASVVQALEFTASKWQAGQRYEWALQWRNLGDNAPGWHYWDPSQPSEQRWMALPDAINAGASPLARDTWYRLTLEGEIVAGRAHYLRFGLGQFSSRLGQVVPPSPDASADRLALAVQLDGNDAQAPFSMAIDQVQLATQPLVVQFIPQAQT